VTDKRTFALFIVIFVAPIVVAWFDLSVPAAIGLVVLLLLLRWLVTLSGIVAPERTPELELATISASHFVEKLRWCLDLLGVDYVEQVSGATLGVFFRGRSVPQLKIRTGIVRSVIGDSPDILRYLYGRYLHDDPQGLAFLEPTGERVDFERKLDSYARSLQVWVYYHILPARDLTLHAWGLNNPATPAWQRIALRALFPLQALLIRYAFRIDDNGYQRAVARIEKTLAAAEEELADGRESLLGGNDFNFTDITFAAYTGLWLRPVAYGGGRADAVRIERHSMPEAMRSDIERWEETYPRATAWVERLYESRPPAGGAP
jgi:glutathione S-transferase